jgi:hypothetical protein
MNEAKRVLTVLAPATGTLTLRGAEEQLTKPECEALLTDSSRAVQKDAARERPSRDGPS